MTQKAILLTPDDPEFKPSATVEFSWIYAISPLPRIYTNNTGKWLIFRETGVDIDKAWKLVRQATEAGQLGPSATVSTKASALSRYGLIQLRGLHHMTKKQVICVYTYDWTDEADVMRVRRRLYRLGFTEVLAYKDDQSTLEGKYTYISGKRVSLFRV